MRGGESNYRAITSPRSRLISIIFFRHPVNEVNYMDLFWSGLARRASEYTRVERKSQFSAVHEIAFQNMKIQTESE